MRRPFISSLGHHYNIKAVTCGTGFTLFVTDDKVTIMIMMMIVMIMMITRRNISSGPASISWVSLAIR